MREPMTFGLPVTAMSLSLCLGFTELGCGTDSESVDTRPASGSECEPECAAGYVCDTATNACIPRPTIVPLFGDLQALYARVYVQGVGPFVMRLDTGAPFTALDPDVAEAEGIQEGRWSLSIEDAPVGERYLYLMDMVAADFEYPDLPGGRVHGSIGNDFFAGFSAGLDFKNLELWLTPSQAPAMPLLHPEDTEGAMLSPMEQPYGYLAVPCSFDTTAETKECLLDTGSPEPLSFADYWSTFSHPSARIVPFMTMDYAGAKLYGYFQRAGEVAMGGISAHGVHVSVFEQFDTLEQVVDILDRDIVGLVGLAALRESFVVIDYANNRIAAFRYVDQSHIPTDEFVGYGIVFETTDGYDLFVDLVIPESDAESAGVQVGDILLRVDGADWWERSDIAWAVKAFLPGNTGESHVFTFERAVVEIEIAVAAEDLLPPIE